MRVRAPVVRIFDRGDQTTVIAKDGVVRRFEGDSAALLRAVLELHARPIGRDELFAGLRERAGSEVPAEPVDQLVALLEAAGVLIAPPRIAPPPALTRRVVLAVTGAIAAVDTPALVRGLHAAGCRVRAVLSRAARRFVTPEALSAITHEKTTAGLWDRDATTPVPHVSLAEWAELVLVAPATAACLARLAAGDARDVVSALVLATRAPVVVVPSMNDAMITSVPVRRNLETLRADGRIVVHPAWGVEVAHDPEARRPALGPAPPAAVILEVVRAVMAEAPPTLPRDPAEWDRLYAAPEALPWWTETLDDDLGAALTDAAAAGAKRLVDLGAGAGALALEAARRGFEVVATDVSAAALALGRRRAGELPIAWVLDDVTHTRLWGSFDVACDRGLFHCLGRSAWPAYAEAIARLVIPGGRLVLKVHTPEEAPARGTNAPADAELRALFAGTFEVKSATPSTLPGPGPAARAFLYVLERRVV